MRLTTFSDYTLRVLIFLALEPEKIATVPSIAAAYGISEHHLMKVAQHLARQEIVETLRGKGGGLRLAVPAEKIRLGQIVKCAEGEQPIVECLDEKNACCITPSCRLAAILVRAFASLYDVLDQYTLADLLDHRRSLKQALGHSLSGVRA